MKLPLYLLALSSVLLHAQGGSLTPPPGAPVPTMKSLDQIEARTPLIEGATGVSIDPGTGGITISASGSYYLTRNLTVSGGNGITIDSDNVSLDLNGFTITSVADPSTGNGISSSHDQITITNGRIAGDYSIFEMDGAGFSNGINAVSSKGVFITRITVVNLSGNGISLSNNTDILGSVESCHVNSVGGTGIQASTVKNCTAMKCTLGGIASSFVSDSRGYTTGGFGIAAQHVSNCDARSVTGHAIQSAHVVNSSGRSTDGNGIQASTVSQSSGTSSNSIGINAMDFVTHSRGRNINNNPGMYGIKTKTAIGCYTNSLSADHKYNMP